ncbi:MAG: DUF6502 family protein [Steroidobacteraceae bacterium]
MAPASSNAHSDSGLSCKEGRSSQRDSRNPDLEQLLFELALTLLPRGITPSSFSKLSREAFIRAAAGHARLRNGKVNHSKVAALTGLPRKEIRRTLNRKPNPSDQDSTAHMPSARVVRGWLTDRRFLTRKGRPRSLVISGETFSFDRLVKEYGGDVSPRAVLEELVRSRTVRRAPKGLELQVSKLPHPRAGLGSLVRVIPALVDGLRIAARQPTSNIDSMLYRLILRATTEAELALLRARCSSAVHSLLQGLQESLEHEFTISSRRPSSTHALAVTVLLADSGSREGSGDSGRPKRA